MENNFEIEFFLLGVPKAASSWIYRCFKEHPEIYVPEKDSLRYFDLKYHKGISWYKKHYEEAEKAQIKIDPSPTYFRSPVAPQRIANDFPNAKFILCLRNPVDRAFSQFWHEKKNQRFDFDFSEVIDNFLLYSWYVETGFYCTHLKKFLGFFDKNRFKILLYDELNSNPSLFISKIFEFLCVDSSFQPSILNKRVNVAGFEKNIKISFAENIFRAFKNSFLFKGISLEKKQKIKSFLSNKNEYEKGIPSITKDELISIYKSDIAELENLTGIELSQWKR